ncbi:MULTISPECIES: hypothetical protein [Legionella]|uniref:hypothetical protein n=1 Tax=Legionella TaxID=445 RepID=UPI000F8EB275|nr:MULTISPECIES: hypothetical protein [Legionella]MCP0914356.1 hypothetical protein [Legionella sp. 27cVA30]RUR00291.1 hypothetical protein ELY11_02795 [Legionella septentrionalis]RUR11852.1 hypothetical protein ELY14_01000 [Legionella septentrionalis]RUR17539.1 hypothetical protein ELY10_00995 [Legionella septentrionalis]
MGFFSPLHGIVENSHSSPHSATIKSTLTRKFADAFGFWAGGINNRYYYDDSAERKYSETGVHVGIFDYLTLGIPLLGIGCLLASTALALSHWLGTIPLAVSLALNAPFLVARLIFGAVLTIISSPVILAVHAIATHAARQDVEKMLALQGRELDLEKFLTARHFISHPEEIDENNLPPGYNRETFLALLQEVGNTSLTLAEFLKNNNLQMEDCDTAYTEIEGESSLQLGIQHGLKFFNVTIPASAVEQKERLTSFLKFNFFATTEILENRAAAHPHIAEFLPK